MRDRRIRRIRSPQRGCHSRRPAVGTSTPNSRYGTAGLDPARVVSVPEASPYGCAMSVITWSYRRTFPVNV